MTVWQQIDRLYRQPGAGSGPGPRVVGYVGLDVPFELIVAAGMTPLRLRAEVQADNTAADPYIESAWHPVLRALLASLLEHRHGRLDHLILGTTPAMYSNLYLLLLQLRKMDPRLARLSLAQFDFPRGVNDTIAGFDRDSLRVLRQDLELIAENSIPDYAIRQAIEECNENRRLLMQMDQLRRGSDVRISGVQAMQLVELSTRMTPEKHSELLREVLGEAFDHSGHPGKRVLYSGSETTSTRLYEALESNGLLVVADDQNRGSRSVPALMARYEDPLEALCRAYRLRTPEGARTNTASRVESLLAQAVDNEVEGVVFWVTSYDQPPGWDFQAQSKALDAAGIPYALLPADIAFDAAAVRPHLAKLLHP